MTKEEYLDALRKDLEGKTTEVDSLVEDYRNYIDTLMEEGISIERICERLGTPAELSNEILQELRMMNTPSDILEESEELVVSSVFRSLELKLQMADVEIIQTNTDRVRVASDASYNVTIQEIVDLGKLHIHISKKKRDFHLKRFFGKHRQKIYQTKVRIEIPYGMHDLTADIDASRCVVDHIHVDQLNFEGNASSISFKHVEARQCTMKWKASKIRVISSSFSELLYKIHASFSSIRLSSIHTLKGVVHVSNVDIRHSQIDVYGLGSQMSKVQILSDKT